MDPPDDPGGPTTRRRHPDAPSATAATTSRRRRWSRRRIAVAAAATTVVLALLYAVVCVVAAFILTKGTHRPLDATPAEVGSDVETVTFQSRVDHLTLSGWLAHSAAHSGRSVILVHGRDSNRAARDYGAIPMARDLLAHGDDVLMFDLRSSGVSQGDRFTLGQDEPRDLLGAYDFMRRRGYTPSRMGVLGWSEGAVTVIEAASQLQPVAALVADSAFADLRPILDTQIPKNDPLPRLFDWGSILAARLLFGFNPDLRPVDAVRALPDRAFLFFQGGADDTVPPDNAVALRRASADPASTVVVIPGAGHVQGFKTDTALYLRTLFAFLDAQVAAHGG